MNAVEQMRPNLRYTPRTLAKQTGKSESVVRGELKAAHISGFMEEVKQEGMKGKFYQTKQIDIFGGEND
jgi:hypothetical protein